MLEVVVPRVEILGPTQIFVNTGKTLSVVNLRYDMISGGEVTIECVTDNVISRPEYVLWTFNGKVSPSVCG